MMARLQLSWFALAFFAYAALAAIVSILLGWPAQFGGRGDPAQVAVEFVVRGTATAPPLLPLIALGVAGWSARFAGRWGLLAAGVLSILGVLFVVGGLGEILAPEPTTAPRPVLIVGGLVAAFGGALLTVLSLRSVVRAPR
jgi:hypothetical protein